MTARETADRLAEMTGGFEQRRDAIEAALADAYRRGGREHAGGGSRARRGCLPSRPPCAAAQHRNPHSLCHPRPPSPLPQ